MIENSLFRSAWLILHNGALNGCDVASVSIAVCFMPVFYSVMLLSFIFIDLCIPVNDMP